jgi:hypothetical protein
MENTQWSRHAERRTRHARLRIVQRALVRPVSLLAILVGAGLFYWTLSRVSLPPAILCPC